MQIKKFRPLVSVISPAYNCESFIERCIESVLRQNYDNVEHIIINDFSNDKTKIILDSYKDKRIKIYNNETNLGPALSRNIGISAAKGDFIAWLDADDFMEKSRISLQVDFLRKNLSVDIVGTFVKTVGGSKLDQKILRYPKRNDYITTQMLFDNPIAMSSVLVRRDVVENQKILFNKELIQAEDYDYWVKLSTEFKFANLKRPLTNYQIHPNQISKLNKESGFCSVRKIQSSLLSQLGIELGNSEWVLHQIVGIDWGRGANKSNIEEIKQWLLKIKQANEISNIYDQSILRRIIDHRLKICEYYALKKILPVAISRVTMRIQN
jgi:glycosyltransferase involved in cell wall biosynthesis